MTIPPDEYGDLLRRAMRAEADSVVPSPEGLEIIRQRIENRGFAGLRNLFWWRIGASIAAAALVAGTVVMVVPGLRDRVGTDIGLTTGNETGQLPEIGATNQPPPPPPTAPLTILPASPTTPPEVSAESTQTAPPSPPSAAPTPDPCASPLATPTVVEPTGDEDCPPEETPSATAPTPKPTPTEAPTQPSPSPTPSGCTGDGCSATPSPVTSSGPATESSGAALTPSAS
ncbi:hypothetical protein Aph01nite_63770 [Acrocarpospora phusangensis]|uniref:Uncharacterized protein n=1 Tax=Acrocarpospora phusangensis TaxID=1070424 RepID=A0A919URI1_9ACTN|nr:hypothetical protein [Acrocarpospora phusangensis]GIH28067.1 hypothetical protein Aph01nite_63770 [Acrocarpospora phusangensis]